MSPWRWNWAAMSSFSIPASPTRRTRCGWPGRCATPATPAGWRSWLAGYRVNCMPRRPAQWKGGLQRPAPDEESFMPPTVASPILVAAPPVRDDENFYEILNGQRVELPPMSAYASYL